MRISMFYQSNRYLTIKIVLLFLVLSANFVMSQTAYFTGSPTTGYAPLIVKFTDQSTGDIISWNWSFPGSLSPTKSGKGPHWVMYFYPGTYSVTLVVTDTTMQTDTQVRLNYIVALREEPEEELDFGDAPDDSSFHYRTLRVNDGARHVADSTIYLGSFIDTEPDGQPTLNADGDDLNGIPDDEDGVVFTSPLIPGSTVGVSINVVGDGFLNAWVDFDQNGFWDDPAERIFSYEHLSTGTWTYTGGFAVPASAVHGTTYARFRFSTDTTLSYYGWAENGEVEDYQVEIVDSIPEPGEYLDYGDAPDFSLMGLNYHTLFINDGARHVADSTIYLGSFIDTEPDGKPTPLADGDDLNGVPDDEDGVVFTSALVPGNLANVTISVVGNGFLNAWVDFDRNGHWDEPAERVFSDLYLGTGSHPESFPIPYSALPGMSYARFRFSTDSTISYKGWAPDGEVEDYIVLIDTIPEPEEDLDFGDAPDDSSYTYHTLLVNDGARHALDSTNVLTLGSHLDFEPDGQPTLNADGDDVNGVPDDEDGVVFTTALIPGNPANVTINVVGIGYLNAWVDFDRNGHWDEPAERVFSDLYLGTGSHPESFPIPYSALPGMSYARFRFSTDSTISYKGWAPNGEVEDYIVTIDTIPELEEHLDYGDAPDDSMYAYHTLLVNDGARHLVDSTIYMGIYIDGEPDGQPTLSADGDDINGVPDDEDGVVFTTALVPGNLASMTVSVVGNGFLNAWMDFDGDGHWIDPEQIFIGHALVTGSHTLGFSVPAGAVFGQTYARFRFSTDTTLNCYGWAPDGEVEDYTVDICTDTTGIKEGLHNQIPTNFALLQNYPNPFNPETRIEYHLPQPSEVKLVIYDIRGQIVRGLIQGIKPAGYHEIIWDSRDNAGQKAATGIYIYRVEIKSRGAGGKQYVDVKKMVLMK